MKLPLLETLFKYHNENNLILSMPGNKCGKGFLRDSIGREFLHRMGKMDITEVEPLDNLHCPEGVIMESQEMLAEAYGAKRAFFLVNGSSSGNMSAIFSAFNEGDEVIVERNCHKSVYNGLILRKLKVIYIEPIIDEKLGLPLPVDEEHILKAVDKCHNPKGIILTYPNYFGISYDVEKILKDLKKKNIISIIDAAHGAHYGFNEKLPKSPVLFADYIILSAHKTLPALTQGAYLMVNREEDTNIETYLSMFTTTSPSYLIMASLDYARYYMQTYGEKDYECLINYADKYRKKINFLDRVHILEPKDIEYSGYIFDKSRYIMMLPKGYSGEKLLNYLRSKKIQCEMSFGSCVVLLLSPFNAEDDFEKIYSALTEIKMDSLKEKNILKIPLYNKIPQKILEPFEAVKRNYEERDYSKCKGKIARESIIPYPPGIPLVCSGELIDEEIIKSIEKCVEEGHQIIGVSDKMIKILV